MIVTCEACTTSFQLDEARIPVGGARVRCSRCKHTFLLPHPSDSSSEAAHRIAAEVAADTLPGVPPASSDLPARERGSGPKGSASLDPDEEDWQFNAEVRGPGDDEPEPDAEDDFDVGSDFGEGFDEDSIPLDEGVSAVVASDRDVAPTRTAPSTSEDARDGSSFGSVDDFSSWMQDDGPEEAGSTGLETGAEPAELGRDDSHAGVYAKRGGVDDLGEPESWDLIGTVSRAATRRATAGTAASAGSRAGRQPPLASSADFIDRFGGDTSFADDLEAPTARQATARWLGLALGWGVTLTLVVAALIALLQPEWARWSVVGQRTAIGPFVAETSAMTWVDTSRMGMLLVVRGRSSNAGPKPIWPHPVQITLLDAAGGRLALAPVAAGVPLAEPVLRESEPEVLEQARLRAVSDFVGEPLAPGETRSFEAVLTGVPAEARRVLLEISGSDSVQSSAAPAAAVEAAIEPDPVPPVPEPDDQLGRVVEDSLERSP